MLSTVIPVYNERESLATLYAELSEVAAKNGYQLDIVLVDDGSTDGSWREIERLAAADPRVRGIRFRRNFGKAAALSAGFNAARGDLVMTLDADLQDQGAAAFHRQLVKGDLSVEYDNEIRLWLEELREIECADEPTESM